MSGGCFERRPFLNRSVGRRYAGIGGLLLLLSAGCAGGDVVRLFSGMEVRGRFINDWAYASYARGVESEARGRDEDALRFYGEAEEQDPASVEIWTRLGAVRCRLGLADADAAFVEALERDDSYEPLWRERARCAEAKGDLEGALALGRRSVELDPTSEPAVVAFARQAARSGHNAEAERWLRSAVARVPRSRALWEAIAAHASGAYDASGTKAEAWRFAAERRLASLSPTLDDPRATSRDETTPHDRWRDVDAALLAGSLDDARAAMTLAHLDLRLLPARAIVMGQPALAEEEATLRLGANPDDSDTRVALLLAADLLGRVHTMNDLVDLPATFDALSDWGAIMFAELLSRHVGRDAAATFLGLNPAELEGPLEPRRRLVRVLSKGRS